MRRLHVDAGNLAREVTLYLAVLLVNSRLSRRSTTSCLTPCLRHSRRWSPGLGNGARHPTQVIIAERRPLVIPGLDGRVARLQAHILIARRRWQALAAELESTANPGRCAAGVITRDHVDASLCQTRHSSEQPQVMMSRANSATEGCEYDLL